MKKILSILLTIISAIQILVSQSVPVDSIHISKDDYIPNFLSINSIVKKEYSHLKSKKIDIDFLAEKYLSQIEGIAGKESYIKILMEYFAELKNSHTGLFLQPVIINCSAELVENALFLNWIDEEKFIAEGIEKYDEIIKIDDIPVIDWLKNEKKYVCSSTDADMENRTLWRVFIYEFNVPRKYEIKTKKGIKTVTLQFNKLYPFQSNNRPMARSYNIRDSIGYLEIFSMNNRVVADFLNEYEKIKKLPYLILDIRRNGGGNSGISEKIVSFFISKTNRACVSRKKIKPNSDHYQGKLFVLIHVNTFSAAESFALDLLESNSAVFIGSQTGGDTGNAPRVFTTRYGFTFRIPTRKPPQISFKGFPMEGIGIKPHIEVKLTIEDYLKNKDTVLEYAINYIEKENKNSP